MAMAVGMERKAPGRPQGEPTGLWTLGGKAHSYRPGVQEAGAWDMGAQGVHSLGRGRSHWCRVVCLPESNTLSTVSECSPGKLCII